jgi:uncharacterized membrane protein
MTKSGKYLLGIFFNVVIIIFLLLAIFDFVPSLSQDYRETLIIIIAGILMVQALKCASKMHEKEKDKD